MGAGGDADGDGGPRARARAVGPGEVLGRYELLEELGTGGMATVYRARDRELRREVAVKVLFPHLARQPEIVARFHREARAAAAIEHPGILRVIDVGGGDAGAPDPPYIVLELVRGGTLRELAAAHGPLLAETVAAIGVVLAEALAAVHRAGVIHRDVKPANVLATSDGRLLLADFGVAYVGDDDGLETRTGALLGTPAFMAPEQALGQAATPQGDVYALGATLYQLATGQLPAGAGLRVDTAVVPAARRRPAVGGELSRLLEELMAPEPAGRPASAAAAATRLRELTDAATIDDPRAEIALLLADPTAYLEVRTPVVVAQLVARAGDAERRGQLPRAIALADRAAALAPGSAEVDALVARLTAGQRRGRWRRRAIALVGGGAVLAAVTAGVLAGRGATTPAVEPALLDAAVAGELAPADAARPPVIARAPVDAAPSSTPDAARLASAPSTPRAGRPDAAPAAPDAAPRSAPDAAPRSAPDAAPVPASLVVDSDAWCDVYVDGTALGRADRSRALVIAPGAHTVRCSQGPGLPSWEERVVLAPGQRHTVRATLLGAVRVTVAVAGDEVVVDGARSPASATLSLTPGRHRVEVRRAGARVAMGWVSIPRVPACTLKDTPALDCY
ncbi:MAG: protein kinase [Kofleriaceae bacterium]